MSCTEIFGFNKKGDAYKLGEIGNAFKGAMMVWNYLDKKYLPKYYPEWAKVLNGSKDELYYRTSDSEEIKKIWALFKSDKIALTDKIVLGSTFDNVIVKKENISKLLKTFREFEGETSLKEQADLIEKAVEQNNNLIAVAWNQTSINGDNWTNYHYDDAKDEYSPYNIFKDTGHWELFEEYKNVGD